MANKRKTKKRAAKKTRHTRKATPKKNRLGVKNSLVNNINARKKKGIAKNKSKHTVSKASYKRMQKGWKKKE